MKWAKRFLSAKEGAQKNTNLLFLLCSTNTSKKGRRMWGWGKRNSNDSMGTASEENGRRIIYNQKRYDALFDEDFFAKLNGNGEGRLYDTDRDYIMKRTSNRLWPKDENQIFPGMRVEAADENGNFHPGSITQVYKLDRERILLERDARLKRRRDIKMRAARRSNGYTGYGYNSRGRGNEYDMSDDEILEAEAAGEEEEITRLLGAIR